MVTEDTLTSKEQNFYTIEQVASRTGFTKRTLRYYEEVGLLPPTDRTEGNYRRYSEADIQRLERIKNLRDLLGFSLTDIRKLLEAEDGGGKIKVAYRNRQKTLEKVAKLDRGDELIEVKINLIKRNWPD